MPEYRVELTAYVQTEWVGEADSEEEAEQLALSQVDDTGYEVDFTVQGIWEETQQ